MLSRSSTSRDAVRGDQGASSGAGEGRSELHSIVFVTKRPGGYDVLLEALARQTSQDYELICVDELADSRGEQVALHSIFCSQARPAPTRIRVESNCRVEQAYSARMNPSHRDFLLLRSRLWPECSRSGWWL